MALRGRVWKFGDEINTDIIIPARFCGLSPAEFKTHIMEPVRSGFYSLVKEGDVIFGGKAFGMGSSRGHAVVALQEAGIKAIVAYSFARIFYRSSINEGLTVIECPEAYQATNEGDVVQIDILSGTITNETQDRRFTFPPFPELVHNIIAAGGGVAYYRKQLQGKPA